MPLSIKTGAVKVKDSDGDYVDIDLTLSDGYAPLESPAFTGTPTAPTPGVSDDSTKIATTAFVQDVVDSLDAGDIEYSSGATYSNGSTGKELQDLGSAISKNNISDTIFHDPTNVCSNLDNAVYGVDGYNPNSSNIPVAGYGIVFTAQTNSWKYQFAEDTNGNLFARRNINSGGWTAWESLNITSEGTITSSVSALSGHYTSYVKKQGKFVNLSITSDGTLFTQNRNYSPSIFSIPVGFRPLVTVFAPCVYYKNGNELIVTIASISSAGDIGFFSASDNLQIAYVRLLATYAVN